MKCCNTSNPLRRDGTSQKQRFPLGLREDYVRIDERSYADILNFSRQLAEEFNYYSLSNNTAGNWKPFFEQDLSFMLATVSEADLGAYKTYFQNNYEKALSSDDTTHREGVKALITLYAKSSIAELNGAATIPMILAQLIQMMPGSELFSDDSTFSFKDLMVEAQNRLGSVFKKFQELAEEANQRFLIEPAPLIPPVAPVSFNWSVFKTAGWTTIEHPFALLGPSSNYYYINSTDPKEDLDKALIQFKVTHDTFVGIVEGLQAASVDYMAQSLQSYAWHNPQVGLFLAFMQLFKHAQDHINTLGRKHLLYYYKDVLRFKERELVGDQAAVILELRKIVPNQVIPAGTLFNGGKDKLGKPRYYAATVETVINQAKVTKLQTMFVERKFFAEDTANTLPEFEIITNIFAAPKANSADGLGADLPKDEPKWSLLGASQLGLSGETRTMPDAQLGFAVASPMFMMKEGRREVVFNFVIDNAAGTNTCQILDYLAQRKKRLQKNLTLAEIEANIRAGLNVEYTGAKGWVKGKVDSVLIANQTSTLPAWGVQLDTGNSSPDFSKFWFLSIKVLLDESQEPCVQYSEKAHAANFATKWPVMRFVVQGQSVDFGEIGIPTYFKEETLAIGDLRFFGGTVFKATFNGKHKYLSDLTPIYDFDEILLIKHGAWQKGTAYGIGKVVIFDGKPYQAIKNHTTNTSALIDPSIDPTNWIALDLRTYVYEYLSLVQPNQLKLRASVSGMMPLTLENDGGRLKNNKPFQPFGAEPAIGSRLHLGGKEIFGKALDQLEVKVVWQDPPTDMWSHYNLYTSKLKASDKNLHFASAYSSGYYVVADPTNPGKNSYKDWGWVADFSLLYNGVWLPLSPKNRRTLFDGSNAKEPITFIFKTDELSKFQRDLDLSEPIKLDSNTSRGYLRMELTSPSIAFGHKAFRDIFAFIALQKSKETTAVTSNPFPNEPYLPIIKELTISYVSRAVVELGEKAVDESAYNERIEQFFHINPFGHSEEHPYLAEMADAGSKKVMLLPQFPAEGYLLIGIEQLAPPCTLSVLFQLLEGSADPDLEREPISWSYLSDNRWVELESRHILLDTTEGLIASGVIRFEFLEDMNLGNTVSDGNLHWLRARVNRKTAAYLKALDILAQAVVVQFQDNENEFSHLEKALPNGEIKALKVNDPKVKSVAQPYSSFGGKLPEQNDGFLTRVSERLRHKQRSVNVWDYERMVLEEFPSIYKVKTLNHTELNAEYICKKDWEISAGHVAVICIPDMRNVNSMNPFEPKTSVRVLNQIGNFLKKHSSPWVDLRVANPIYEEITIDCKVGFMPGKDPGYYIAELEREIQEYLSPWAFDSDVEIVFGGRLHKSQIIDFIERHDYVDFVLNFKMNHKTPDGLLTDVEEAVSTTGRSIMVSAQHHLLRSVQPSPGACDPVGGGGNNGNCACNTISCDGCDANCSCGNTTTTTGNSGNTGSTGNTGGGTGLIDESAIDITTEMT